MPASPLACAGWRWLAGALLIAWGTGALLTPLVFACRCPGLLAETGGGRAAVYLQAAGALVGFVLALLCVAGGLALLCGRRPVGRSVRSLLALLAAYYLALVLLPALAQAPQLTRGPLALFYNAPGVLYNVLGALGGAGAALLLRRFLAAPATGAVLALAVGLAFVRLGVRLLSAPADLSILTHLWQPTSATSAAALLLTMGAALLAWLAALFLRARPAWAGVLVTAALLAGLARVGLDQSLPHSFPHTPAGTLMRAADVAAALGSAAEYLLLLVALRLPAPSAPAARLPEQTL